MLELEQVRALMNLQVCAWDHVRGEGESDILRRARKSMLMSLAHNIDWRGDESFALQAIECEEMETLVGLCGKHVAIACGVR